MPGPEQLEAGLDGLGVLAKAIGDRNAAGAAEHFANELFGGGGSPAATDFGRIPVGLSHTSELRLGRNLFLEDPVDPINELDELDVFDPKTYKYQQVIRFSDGPSLLEKSVNGQPEIIFDGNNQVRSVTFTPEMSVEQRKQELMIAGFANLIHSDPDAIAAVSNVPGKTIGFVQQDIVRAATREQMQEQAVRGAEAYVRSEQGNAFTKFLRTRYGQWTPNDTRTMIDLTDELGRLNFWEYGSPAPGLSQSPELAIRPPTDGTLLKQIRDTRGGLDGEPTTPPLGHPLGRPGQGAMKTKLDAS